MSPNEAIVIIVGVVAGYWVVSKLFFRSGPGNKPTISLPPAVEPNARPYWHQVLEVPPAASAPQIRDAYKHLISKYHPDKVETLGKELKDLAARKSQEITVAYQEGMRARGETP